MFRRRLRRSIVSCVLFGAILASAPLSLPLEAQDETTRAGEWQRRRREKAGELHPPVRNGLENALYQFEERRILERFRQGFAGFHPRVGGLVTGSGFALGAEFRSDALQERDALLRVSAQGSLSGYQHYEVEAGRPHLAGGRAGFSVMGTYRNYPQEDFFGRGPESQVGARTNYRMEAAGLTAAAEYRPWDWLAVGATGGYMRTHIGSGTDSRFPSIEFRFDEAAAPGLDRQPDFVRAGTFARADYRDNPTNPRDGGLLRVRWESFEDVGETGFSFQQVEAEFQHYIPFWNLRRVIAFRTKTSFSLAGGDDRVPFFLQPTLGGSEDLRGYREFRFRDRHMLLMNLEYRWEIFSGLDMAVFGDAGQVAPRISDLDLSEMEAAYGFGARFNSASGVFFRVDTGFSHEGRRVFMKFGHVF